MTDSTPVNWLNASSVEETLSATPSDEDKVHIREILAKGREMKGLGYSDVATLMTIKDPELEHELFTSAKVLKDRIYGPRVVLFAPMYISNLCKNECLYCAFRVSNKALKRKVLTMDEIAEETRILVNQGHKRVLLVSGEAYPPKEGFDYIIKAIETVYATKGDKEGAEIRRINVNLAPETVENFRRLKEAEIGTYQLFQETYDRRVYKQMHTHGKKSDFDWRVTALDRAMEAGIDDLGMGVLFGLSDWRFEVLSLMQHIEHLEDKYGVGCHTISMPRLEPAHGSDIASNPPHAVSDSDLKRIIAILRLAVPYTGMIISTRETPEMRRETIALGISQISAGSRTNPGGYAAEEGDGTFSESQFQLGDHRPLNEVVAELAEMGLIPSFCTACYRLGRTGDEFMEWAKSGEIHHRCGPNALSTFREYLIDYTSKETIEAGEKAIAKELSQMPEKDKRISNNLLRRVKAGKRDCYC